MTPSRRAILKWALGGAQLAVLDRFGLLRGTAHAQVTDAPTRLLVFYIPGGFRLQYGFWPLPDDQLEATVPVPTSYLGEPVFFRSNGLVELAPPNGDYAPLRVWR